MPINPDETHPGDDDVVANFPANERASRVEIVEFMDVEHNHVNGRHKFPVMGTADRDALTDMNIGTIIFNTDTYTADLYLGASLGWTPFGAGVPQIGSMMMWTGDPTTLGTPTRWALCNGQAISRTTYSDLAGLYQALSWPYGSGNGTTTFNLPNLKGRVVVGFDPADADYDNLAATSGEKKHALSAGEIPTTDAGGAHAHTTGQASDSVRKVDSYEDSYVALSYHTHTIAEAAAHTHAFSGSGTAHENRQPYIVMPYIIRII